VCHNSAACKKHKDSELQDMPMAPVALSRHPSGVLFQGWTCVPYGANTRQSVT